MDTGARLCAGGLYPAVILFCLSLPACSNEEQDNSAGGSAPLVSTKAIYSEAPGEGAATLGNAERGAYVAVIGHCTGCHSARDAQEPGTKGYFAGTAIGDLITVPNITPDPEQGIGSWSDEEILNAIRNGRRPDGRQLDPVMPYRFLHYLTDRDALDLVAYLKTVPASSNVANGFVDATAFPPDRMGEVPPPLAAEEVGETVARGAYVVWMSHCMTCHTPKGIDGKIDFANQLGAGGVIFRGNMPAVSSNLTSDPDDGVSAYYSADELIHILRTGTRPDSTDLAPIMGARGKDFRQEDLEAVAAYLKQLPPVPSP